MTYKKAFEDHLIEIKVKEKQSGIVFKCHYLGNKIYFDNTEGHGESLFENMRLNHACWDVFNDGTKYKKFNAVISRDDRDFIKLFFESSKFHIRKEALKFIENEFVLNYIAKNDENEELKWRAYNKV